MVNPVVFLVSRVVINIFLHVHILAWIVGPWLFHIPTLVLYLCTIFLPSMWLLCIYPISGVGHALFSDILPQNHQLPR